MKAPVPTNDQWAQQRRSVSQTYLQSCLDPRHILRIGYFFCCLKGGTHSPRKNKVVAMAKRFWALLLISRCPTVDPSQEYDAHLENQILAIIADLPCQNWSLHFKAIGLTNLPRGHPGPKPGRRAAGRYFRRLRFWGGKISVSLPLAMAKAVRERAAQQQLTIADYLRGLICRDAARRAQGLK